MSDTCRDQAEEPFYEPLDHPLLDVLATISRFAVNCQRGTRESDCVELAWSPTGWRYEIVVRRIDSDARVQE